MKGKRTNPEYRGKEADKPKEPETVMVISKDIEDPILNPPKQETKPFEVPRADDPKHGQPISNWMAEAIADKDAEFIVVDDKEQSGKKEEPVLEIPVEQPVMEEPPVGPIQEALSASDETRFSRKKELERSARNRDLVQQERLYYSQMRRSRAIPIPEVPSEKKPYPSDTIIAYAPYSSQDLEDINNPDIPTYDKYLIILEGIYTAGITPNDLTFADFMFISDVRQLQALGDVTFKYPYVCKTCGRPGTYIFKLSNIAFEGLEANLPLKVRFHSFPNEEFLFAPHTIGDVLFLMKTDRYWRKIGSEYLLTKEGDRTLDTLAINASQCVSHNWEDAYIKFLVASENPNDRRIFNQIEDALYHGTKPIKFKCTIPLDKTAQSEMAQMTAKLVNDVASGNVSMTTPNVDVDNLPPWAKVHFPNADTGSKERGELKLCGAPNEIDVVVGDVIIPFCSSPGDMEYGILGV